MPSTSLVPHAFWFRLAFACPRIEGLPRPDDHGGLLDLPANCALPAVSHLEGRSPRFTARSAWNERGLALSLQGRGEPLLAGTNPSQSDIAQVWVDTRDTRDIHRATKFCHRFGVRLSSGNSPALSVEVAPRSIPRAQAEPPRPPRDAIRARAQRGAREKNWLLELFFEAAALHGFDPETNRRLGLMVMVHDWEAGEAFLGGLGREFPIESDPSLWATLELRDEPPSAL